MEIQVQHLRKSFNGQQVLDGVNLTIPAGKITVIIGGSGAGKSVFLKHLNGLLRPDSGSIRIDGQEVTRLGERDLLPIRRRIGYIFQGGALLASLNVGENVALGLVETQRTARAAAAAAAREKLTIVGLAEAFAKYPAELSGGMLKRASVARALTMNPEAILYDEPTAGLDPPRSRQIEDVILDVARRLGVTSVVVTHDMDSVRKLADQVYMLHEGKINFAGTPRELWAAEDPIVREFIER